MRWKGRDVAATCHPDRKQVARGLCRSCYGKAPKKQRLPGGALVTCGHTDRKHFAFGLCHPCYKTRHYNQNREKYLKRSFELYQLQPERGYQNARNAVLRKYGITEEDYQRMFKEQDGKCAICKAPPSKKKKLAVDHNHTTGKVRELLCTKCNAELAPLENDPVRLQKMIDYLARHGTEVQVAPSVASVGWREPKAA